MGKEKAVLVYLLPNFPPHTSGLTSATVDSPLLLKAGERVPLTAENPLSATGWCFKFYYYDLIPIVSALIPVKMQIPFKLLSGLDSPLRRKEWAHFLGLRGQDLEAKEQWRMKYEHRRKVPRAKSNPPLPTHELWQDPKTEILLRSIRTVYIYVEISSLQNLKKSISWTMGQATSLLKDNSNVGDHSAITHNG